MIASGILRARLFDFARNESQLFPAVITPQSSEHRSTETGSETVNSKNRSVCSPRPFHRFRRHLSSRM